MRNDTIKAKEILEQGHYTCVLCKGTITYTSTESGVKPLLSMIEMNTKYTGFCAADKIVGKAAAMLYVVLGVTEVYSDVMSEDGLQMLQKHHISAYYDTLVKEIRNRVNTDICPMDKAVKNITNPKEGLKAIKEKISGLLVNHI